MEKLFTLLILQQEGITIGVVLQYLGYLGYLLAALGGIVLWRQGLNKLISDSNQTLLKNRTEQLAIAESKIKELKEQVDIREKECEQEIQELKNENRMLRRSVLE